MSFGPSGTTKTAENNLSGTSNAALNTVLPGAMNLFGATTGAAGPQLQAGQGNVNAGTDFLSTILNGNRANTTAMLQPNISQILQNNQNTLKGINTLMPRGGGRSASLFENSFAPTSQISNLFSNARTGAATALPQIGLQQEGIGTNLFGLGASALGAGTGALGASTGANSALGNIGLQQNMLSLQQAQALGKGIMGLLTTPFGGGSSAQGLAGLF